MLSIIESLCESVLDVNNRYILSKIKTKEEEIINKFRDEIDYFVSQYGDNIMVITNFTLDKDKAIFINPQSSIVKDTGVYFQNRRKSEFFYKKLDEFKKGIIQEDIFIMTLMNVLTDTVHFIIRYKDVTVENEFGESTYIEELFVDIPICTSLGNKVLLAPVMTRAKFSKEHFASGYMHSHAKMINIKFDFNWRALCFGNGPMSEMIMNIRSGVTTIEESLPMILFNMDRYVTVESIKGTPYIKLKNTKNVNFYRDETEIKLPIFKNPIESRIRYSDDRNIDDIIIKFFKSKERFPSFTTMFLNAIMADNPIRVMSNSKKIGGITVKYDLIENVNLYDFIIKLTNMFNDVMVSYSLIIGIDFEDIYEYMNERFFSNYTIETFNEFKRLVKVNGNADECLSSTANTINKFIDENKNTSVMIFNGENITFSCDKIEPINNDPSKYTRLLDIDFANFIMSIINEYF